MLRARAIGVSRRALQKSHHAEPREHGHTEKGGRLPSRKRLGSFHKVIKVSGPDRVGHTLDLRCRLPDVRAGNRKVAIKFFGCSTDGPCEAADVVRTRALLAIYGLFQLVGCLRRNILGSINEI